MINVNHKIKSGLVLMVLVCPSMIFAAVQEWKIIPNESSLNFTATQNGAPVSGEFKKFDGDIAFDPSQLNMSHVKITVNIASVYTSYSELTQTLTTSDWFDTSQFPQAVFEANQFKKTGPNQYVADGKLTIRTASLPIKITFSGDDFNKSKVTISGDTVLKRTAYGIGQGEWASTNEIKDDVKINFKLSAVKK